MRKVLFYFLSAREYIKESQEFEWQENKKKSLDCLFAVAEVLLSGGGCADDAGGQFWHHLGLDLTIHVIKSQIHLARQSL